MNGFLSQLMENLPGWAGELICEENLQVALRVLESNRDGYYTYIQEEWPTEENLRKDITALPPGRSFSDKTFVLLYREGVPAAVVDYVEGYKLLLTFSDNIRKVVDLEPYLTGEVFAPLRDKKLFVQYGLTSVTIEWANGADLAPEFLYEIGTVA